MSNYTYRGTHTVKNAFGVTDYDDLERIEAAIVKARYTEIDAGSGPIGEFDADLIKALHKHLFQDIYEWAGRTREELDVCWINQVHLNWPVSVPSMLGGGRLNCVRGPSSAGSGTDECNE